MAQPSFTPSFSPFVTSNLLAQQLRMQQTANWGQGMLEQGQQTPQGQMVSGHYVAPSPLQYAAQLLKTSAGRNAVDSLPGMYGQIQQGQQNRARSMFGLGPIGQAPAQTGPSAPQSDVQAFPVGPSGTPQQPPVAGAQPSPQALAAGLQPQVPQMPLLPGKTPQESYTAFTVMGPVEYMKAVASQGAPTDVQKNLIAGGLRPGTPEWNQAMNAVNTKAGYIAPVNVRPGSTVLDPRTNQPIFGAPDNGMQVHYDANGNAYTTQVPGWNQAVSANAQAKATGGAAGKVIGERKGLGAIGAGKAADVARYAPLIKKYETTVIPGESTVASVDRAIGYIDRLDKAISNGALDNVTGARGQYVPDFLMSQSSKDALEDLDSIKSKIVLNTMNEMRQASAAGATGFGNMQQNELKIIEDSLGSINRAQSKEQIRQNLGVIRDAFRAIANSANAQIGAAQELYKGIPGIPTQENLRGQGQEQTATKPSTLSGPNAIPANYGGVVKNGVPAPTSAAQMKSLPSGTVFMAPDGTMRRAP